MNAKKIRVMKFGGSSFPDLESYSEIAGGLKRRLMEGAERIVVVVSAMSGTTGKILEALLKVNPDVSSEITDSSLATGEMVAACLLRAALERKGVRASHLFGFQLGVTTDSKFTRATPATIDPSFLLREFERADVVVIAGGQAVDQSGRVTMLGRNSSDLSAVLVAALLGVDECEIFSDVPGVYSADPYLVSSAVQLKEVPYDAIIALSRGGAKVLHHGAVEYAKNRRIRIVCRGTKTGEVGSVIGTGEFPSAVSVLKNAEFLEFADESERESAGTHFSREGIVALGAKKASRFFLAVSKENRAWEESLAHLPVSFERRAGLAAISILDGSRNVRIELVEANECEARVTEIHDGFHPSKGNAPVFAPSGKTRSPESGLLVSAIRR